MTNYAAALAALDALAAIERLATPAPWKRGKYAHDEGRIEDAAGEVIVYDEGAPGIEDAAAIVALRNIAAPLLALARAVVEERHLGQNLRAPMDFDAKDDALIARLDATDALITALTKRESE